MCLMLPLANTKHLTVVLSFIYRYSYSSREGIHLDGDKLLGMVTAKKIGFYMMAPAFSGKWVCQLLVSQEGMPWMWAGARTRHFGGWKLKMTRKYHLDTDKNTTGWGQIYVLSILKLKEVSPKILRSPGTGKGKTGMRQGLAKQAS